MSEHYGLASVEDAARLAPGDWVIDADGTALCLVDTHMGFPQRMWMPKATKGIVGLVVDLASATYPLNEAELDPEFVCEHKRGMNEMGHCYLCGQVVGELRPVTFSAEQFDVFRAVAKHNERIGGSDE